MKYLLGLVAVLVLSLSGATSAATPSYSIQELNNTGLLRGFTSSINDRGDIAGYGQLPNLSYHAMKWSGSERTDLGALESNPSIPGLSYSSAAGINDSGLIVGTSIKDMGNNTNPYRAVYWLNGAINELPTLPTPSYGQSEANSVNKWGDIAGNSATDVAPYYSVHAVIWKNNKIIDLGTLGGISSYATSINDKGQVVGYSLLSLNDFNTYHAFLWQNGTMQDLGTLGGKNSFAQSINNKGQITGNSYVSDGDVGGAFIWENGVMKNLGVLSTNTQENTSGATSINDRGDIVGLSTTKDRGTHPFIWKDGVMNDLVTSTTTSYSDIQAKSINNRGIIAGRASTQNNDDKAIIWKK